MSSEEEKAIGQPEPEKWKPLTRELAWAARDFSKAGETFIDHNNQVNEILYTTLTALGYQAYVSVQRLQHIEKHLLASKHKSDIPYILNNPDLIVPNYEMPTVHLYYKVLEKILFVVPVHQKEGIRYVATMHKAPTIKGMRERKISQADFLYIRGGFQWKKWK